MSILYQVEIKEHSNGWLFATCKDLPGLFVGHTDYRAVLTNIPEAITMLIENDKHENVKVEEVKHDEPTIVGSKLYRVKKVA